MNLPLPMIFKDGVLIYLLVALVALKRKKQYEDQLIKVSGMISTIDTQIIALDNAQLNMDVLKTMQQGARVHKQINESMYVIKS